MSNRVLLLFLVMSIGLPKVRAQVFVTNERGINTAFQEYSPAFFRNDLVFIAANPAVRKGKNEDASVGKFTTSMFWAKRNADGSLQRPMHFAEELSTKFYDGPLSFNALGNVVYFTRTNLKGGKPKAGRDGKIHLKIYASQFDAEKQMWHEAKELPFCSSDFDCMHPSVSADGQRLYFASNRKGSLGGMDLFVSLLQEGKWSEPVDLGTKVNTPKDEFFPHIHADGTLFFATNGRKALGGLDIYAVKKTADTWLEPQALPEPINSASDDFGIIVSSDGHSGFLSSNRASGQGDDDIFRFNAPNGFEMEIPVRMDEEEKTSSEKHDEKEDATATQPAQIGITPKTEIVSGQKTELPKTDDKTTKTIEKPTTTKTEIVAEQKTDSKKNVVAIPETENKKPADIPKKVENKAVVAPKKVKEASIMVDKRMDKFHANEENQKLDIEVCSFEKVANKPLGEVTVQILSLKMVKNTAIITDSIGRVKGFRHLTGEEVPIEALPQQFDMTDLKGYKSISLINGERYLFNFSKIGYEPRYVVKTVFPTDKKVAAFMVRETKNRVHKETNNLRRETKETTGNMPAEKPTLDVPIEQAFAEVTEGYMFELRGIYYGYGDAEVNIDAQSELQPLLNLMRKNPAIEIEVASHTDTRGKEAFNANLSQLRADNIKTFFVENGIEPHRIKSVGYGETRLRNNCYDGVNCTEDQHALNRRTEIRVLKGLEIQSVTDQAMPTEMKMDIRKVGTRAVDAAENGSEFIADAGNTNLLAVSPQKSKSRYFVIIGTFTKPENAMKHLKKAVNAGFVEAEVIQNQETMLYGVSVRQFTNEKEARKLSDYINQQKQFEAFIKELK